MGNVLRFLVNNIFGRVHGMYRNACNALHANDISPVSHTLHGLDTNTPLILSKLPLLSVKKKELRVLIRV